MNKRSKWVIPLITALTSVIVFILMKTGIPYLQTDSEKDWVTLAFEDKTSDTDYDYNDFVVHIKFKEEIENGRLSKIHLLMRPKAKMGGYRSGFFLNLAPGGSPIIHGSFSGNIIKTSSTRRAPVQSEIAFPQTILEIFPDTSKAVEFDETVELELNVDRPSENKAVAREAGSLGKYSFYLNVVDKNHNHYQIEASDRPATGLGGTPNALPLTLVIPGAHWRIPKDRTSAYQVYPRLRQHIDYLMGLSPMDSPDWFRDVSDPNLVETEALLFKKKPAHK